MKLSHSPDSLFRSRSHKSKGVSMRMPTRSMIGCSSCWLRRLMRTWPKRTRRGNRVRGCIEELARARRQRRNSFLKVRSIGLCAEDHHRKCSTRVWGWIAPRRHHKVGCWLILRLRTFLNLLKFWNLLQLAHQAEDLQESNSSAMTKKAFLTLRSTEPSRENSTLIRPSTWWTREQRAAASSLARWIFSIQRGKSHWRTRGQVCKVCRSWGSSRTRSMKKANEASATYLEFTTMKVVDQGWRT